VTRVALVGLGAISRFYLPALRASPALELVAVCDSDPERLAPFAGVRTLEDWATTIALPDVDAVIVTLPNDLHAPVCEAALRAGRHVCCEKPLATSAADAARLAALAAERGLTLFTAFHRRYNANLAAARPLLAGARLARVRATYLEDIREHSGPDTWYLDPTRCGGGCVADNGPNALDSLCRLLGPLGLRDAEIEHDACGVDQRARLRLETADGAEVDLRLAWDHPGEEKRIECELADGSRVTVDFLAGYPAFKSSLEHEYVGVLADFAARVATGGEHGGEGVAIARLIEHAYAVPPR